MLVKNLLLVLGLLLLNGCDSSTTDTDSSPEEEATTDTDTNPDTPPPDVDMTAGSGNIDAATTACQSVPDLVDMTDAASVACNETDLRAAMVAGGKLRLACETGEVIQLTQGHISIDTNVILDGNGAVLDANNQSRIFSSNSQQEYSQTFQNITFRNGRGVPHKYNRWKDPMTDGGAIFSENKHSLTLINTRFENNVSPHNTASAHDGGESGGGAIVKWGGDITIVRSTFVNNTGSNGGAIKTLPTAMVVHDSVFEGNKNRSTTNNGGGAIVHDHTEKHPQSKICASRFAGNIGYKQGGAIFVFMGNNTDDGDYIIDQSEFIDNEVRENTEGSNTGAANGGALAIARGNAQISRSSFSNNEAVDFGGAVYGFLDGSISIDSSTFYRNSARLGGALSSGIPVDLTYSTIAYNTAGFRSGGITGDSKFTLKNSILAFNSVEDSADVQNNCGRPPEVTGVNLEWPLPDPIFFDNPVCITNTAALANEPLFKSFGDHGGPTSSLPLQAQSPGYGDASECSGTDQLGNQRSSPCSLGAVSQ